MNQISARSDKLLNKASRELGEAEALIEAGTLKKDNAWESINETFNEHGLEGKETRFIADDGFYLQRQERNGSPKLDEEKLEALIFQTYPKAEANRIWNSITVRKVDGVKLEAAERTGKLSASLIHECITPAKKTYARIRQPWTKEDKEKAQIFGVTKS